MFAAVDATGYQVLLLLHVTFVVVAFGGNFVQPMLARSGDVSDEAFGKVSLYIQLPALVLMWVTGMGLVGMSDEIWQMSQLWVILAILTFLAACLLQFLVGRSFRSGNRQMAPMFTGMLHLLMVFGLYLMIFKPGK